MASTWPELVKPSISSTGISLKRESGENPLRPSFNKILTDMDRVKAERCIWLPVRLGSDPSVLPASSAGLLPEPLSMHIHRGNSKRTWDDSGYPMEAGVANSNGGSPLVGPPLSEPMDPDASIIIQMEGDPNDPNPDDKFNTDGGDKKEKQDKFWADTNSFVLTLASGGAVGLVLSKVGSPPSSSSPDAFRVIAVTDGVAFMSSFIGLAVGDKNPYLVKGLASTGAAAGVFMVNVALAEFCYPKHAILVGAIASLPPLLALMKRAFGFNASPPPLLTHIKRAFGIGGSA